MSIPIAPTAQGVPEHKHCEVCGKSIALEGRVCSAECVTRLQEALKAKKRSVYIFLGLFALILFLTYGQPLLQSLKG